MRVLGHDHRSTVDFEAAAEAAARSGVPAVALAAVDKTYGTGPTMVRALISGRSTVADRPRKGGRLPPRWFIRLFWMTHRRLYRWTGGRLGLWRPKPGRWGAMRVTTIGRRTGHPHAVIIGYLDDGPNLVSMAMNGWGDAEPAWWLNLRAHPDATVDLVDGHREVTGRAAQGEERERLWDRWRALDKDLDAYAARRSMETAVVVFEPKIPS